MVSLEDRITSVRNVGWTLGNYCDARCKHCYSWKVRRGSSSLTIPEIDRIVSQLSSIDVHTVNLGGNEPIFTDGPDMGKSTLPYIVRSVHRAGIVLGITTYGVTATELHRRDPAAFALVNDWDISLDSPFREEHDRNRGAGIFNRATAALKLCKDKRKPHSIIMCAMNWNTTPRHLDGLLDLAREYDAELRINSLRPTENHHLALLPSVQQFYDCFEYLARHTDLAVLNESVLGVLCGYDTHGCPCGTTSMRIHSKTPDGKVPVSPCIYLHAYKTGDLLTEDINDIIASEEFRALRKRNISLPASCNDMACEYRPSCRGGCAARAVLMNGSLDREDPYCVKMAQRAGIHLPILPKIVPSHDGVRVHENYLCTYIGKPRE